VILFPHGILEVAAIGPLEQFRRSEDVMMEGFDAVHDRSVPVYALRRHGSRDEPLLYVPVSTARTIGLRPVMAAATADDVLHALAQPPERGDDEEWKVFYPRAMQQIGRGDVQGVVAVYRHLCHRKARRSLSFGEQRLYDGLRTHLIGELGLSKRITDGEAAALLEAAVARSAAP
jgi:RNA polymerase-interacting CarD/CdnL/TRCF family regulator